MSRFLVIALLLLLGGLAWWATSSEEPPTRLDQLPAKVAAPAAAAAPPARLQYTAPVATRTPEPAARHRLVLLPNGEYVPTLNGVLDAPAMDWPASIPYSPIIGRESTSTLDWYVHADGSKSTTQMVFRTDLGRMGPVTTVANPAPVGQRPPDEPGLEPKGGDKKAGAPAGGADR